MAKANVKIGEMIFVKKRSVTRPILQIDGSKPVYFKVDGGIHLAPLTEGQKPKLGPDGKEMQQPHIVMVTNLETGEESTIVTNSILKSELEKTYPSEGYVGLSFAVEKTGSKRSSSGTTYSTYQISEIEIQAPPAVEKPQTKATK
jgi:hypothetical protein